MHLRPEDVQDILSLLDSLSQDEFELRTSELHVTVRRDMNGSATDEPLPLPDRANQVRRWHAEARPLRGVSQALARHAATPPRVVDEGAVLVYGIRAYSR